MSKGIALVTGAAQGIGRAIALQLANDGFDVALNDIPSKKAQLDVVAREVNAMGHKTLVVCADVSSEDDIVAMIKDTVEELGGLDVMVANAGISGSLTPLVDSSTEAWDTVFAINTRGVYLCYKHAAKQMIAQGRGGRIIGASSAAGKRGFPLNAKYSASKFAVRGLTQSAALEPGKHKITVNSYAPGIIDTPMVQAVYDGAENELVAATLLATTAAGHMGKPEDIASIVSYLASKEAHFITGQCVRGDLGFRVSSRATDVFGTAFRRWRDDFILMDMSFSS
ncbi:hypothetical protein BJ138DRAFT_1165313 [Hygrophoropsis aurantiaca]|uniref:Uncharacterized protein n=1 Tax=Hygrophoropsis aurantiaca TaxID=72124 RepID=A0ACB7ZWL2_9AGAM|nr:hypothetical protein BJ138DRAFT_1165313 [Hygrophoropsis aurantiaca]